MSTSAAVAGYRSAAQTRFQLLMQAYNDPGDSYWRLGHAFDTVIDYLDTIDASGAGGVAEVVLRQYAETLKGSYDWEWFDDFGWWAIAMQRAMERPFFGKYRPSFVEILAACWNAPTGMNGKAPYTWERRAPGTYSTYRPAVEGGVWNMYWPGTDGTRFPGPTGDPATDSLAAIQNTVVNGLYLVIAQRLGRTNQDAAAAANREWDFLMQWFNTSDRPLWWQRSPGAALVHERVSHFADGSKSPFYVEDFAWTGDQGLILGGLTDRMSLVGGGPGYTALLARTKELLAGVQGYLVSDGQLQPWTGPGGAEDYKTGPAVFWRYLLHAFRNNADLRAFLQGAAYQQLVRVNADAVKETPSGQDVISLTNDLAVLVVAAAMFEPAATGG